MVPAFNFIGDEVQPQALQRCLLLMEVGERFFSYLFFDRESKKIACLRQYNADPELQPGNAEWLAEVIESDDMLANRPQEAAIIYNYPDSSFLPEKYFHIELNRPMMEMIYGNARKGLVLSEKVHGWHIYNVYRIPRSVHALLQNKFAAGKYWHNYSLLLSSMNNYEFSGPMIRLVIYNDRFSILLFEERELKLVQTYVYEAPEDVSYYLLAVCKQFGLDQQTVKLKLAGLVDIDSALFQDIMKYFSEIETESLPETLEVSELVSQYPEHYFSPLLEMIACV